MVLSILADYEKTVFEVVSKDERLAECPLAGIGRGGKAFVPVRKDNWYEQLEGIRDWVNNELKEECLFEIR